MTVTQRLQVDAFVLEDVAEQKAPGSFQVWQHIFTARKYAHPNGPIETIFHCKDCGQVRPWEERCGTHWVERGMCPAQLDRSFLPEHEQARRATRHAERAIDAVHEVYRAALAVIVSWQQGTINANRDPQAMTRLHRAVVAAQAVPEVHSMPVGADDGAAGR